MRGDLGARAVVFCRRRAASVAVVGFAALVAALTIASRHMDSVHPAVMLGWLPLASIAATSIAEVVAANAGAFARIVVLGVAACAGPALAFAADRRWDTGSLAMGAVLIAWPTVVGVLPWRIGMSGVVGFGVAAAITEGQWLGGVLLDRNESGTTLLAALAIAWVVAGPLAAHAAAASPAAAWKIVLGAVVLGLFVWAGAEVMEMRHLYGHPVLSRVGIPAEWLAAALGALAIRRARGMCVVPADHPIVADFGG